MSNHCGDEIISRHLAAAADEASVARSSGFTGSQVLVTGQRTYCRWSKATDDFSKVLFSVLIGS